MYYDYHLISIKLLFIVYRIAIMISVISNPILDHHFSVLRIVI